MYKRQFIDRVNVNPEWGYKIRGILDDHEEWGKEYKGVRVIGKIDDLDTILALNTLDEIAITLSIQELSLIHILRLRSRHIRFLRH